MTSERSKRRDLLTLSFITKKSYAKEVPFSKKKWYVKGRGKGLNLRAEPPRMSTNF